MDTRKMIEDGATPKEIESQLLMLDSEFHFECRKCGKFGISEHDEFFLLWNRVIATLAEAVHAMEECKTSQKLMEFAYNTIFAVLYLSYDTSADFMPQFDRNAKALLDICRVLKESVKR